MSMSESKTIRIPPTAYHMLTELNGAFSVLRGKRVTYGEIVGDLVKLLYSALYPHLVGLLSNPKEIIRIREEYRNLEDQLRALMEDIKW